MTAGRRFVCLTGAVKFGALVCALWGSAKDKKNGGTLAESTGFIPELGSKDQESTYDLPHQRRQIDGRGHLVRQFLRVAAPRRAFAARLQARHLHHHAEPAGSDV